MSRLTHCRVCNGPIETVFDMGEMAFTGRFPQPGEAVPTGRLALALCTGECGLVQLADSFDLNDLYGPTYGYRSGLNGSMVEHLGHVATRLVKKCFPNKGDLALDIGSSDGTLLKALPSYMTRIGIDPSAAKFSHFYPTDTTLLVDFFPSDDLDAVMNGRKAKIITSIAMFYDLEQPVKFAQQIARYLADDGLWHTEQSYLPRMLSNNSYDTICHEHLEYYGIAQIAYIAKQAGLKIIDIDFNNVNGGSFGVTMALADSYYDDAALLKGHLRNERSLGLQDPVTYLMFKAAVDRQCAVLKEFLKTCPTKPWVFGASTKGNVILQYCNLDGADIGGAYDINPDKEGCVMPGSDIVITATPPDNVRDYLVLPWHFREDILAKHEAHLTKGGRFIFPLPNVEVVG